MTKLEFCGYMHIRRGTECWKWSGPRRFYPGSHRLQRNRQKIDRPELRYRSFDANACIRPVLGARQATLRTSVRSRSSELLLYVFAAVTRGAVWNLASLGRILAQHRSQSQPQKPVVQQGNFATHDQRRFCTSTSMKFGKLLVEVQSNCDTSWADQWLDYKALVRQTSAERTQANPVRNAS